VRLGCAGWGSNRDSQSGNQNHRAVLFSHGSVQDLGLGRSNEPDALETAFSKMQLLAFPDAEGELIRKYTLRRRIWLLCDNIAATTTIP
jgi:hypothetical protein